MLFHVTMTHSEDNCPGYERERMPEILRSFENLKAVGKDLDVKLHFFVWCPPDHVAYVLLEADSLNRISRFAFSIPIRQEIKIVPVEQIEDTVTMAKQLMAEAGKK
ncbi:MAG: DUF3303 family protein [Candidatus Neomarinimicrobiota bacterium]